MPKSLAEVFNPRANSIGFLRWLMAFLVIFSHAGPLGGFYGGEDLGTQISHEQSLGGVAVTGFFFFSGFLITQSRMGRSSTLRYFWRRFLRIFPAWWLSLLTVAFVFGPIAWIQEKGSIGGYFTTTHDSPLTYFWNNFTLVLTQRNIGGMGSELPYAQLHGGYDWNGSAWTLMYEFRAYILVGVLGLFGVLAHRWLAGSVAIAILVLSTLQWAYVGQLAHVVPSFQNIYNLLFLGPFAFGMLFALFPKKIPMDDRLAIGAILVGLATYAVGGWLAYGQYAFCYFLMWIAVRATKLNHWEKYGDLSYGIYIFGWPVMTLVAYFGLQKAGWLPYHLVVIVACHLLAFISWHLIEKPAMSLKNWTPAPLQWVLDRWAPVSLRLKRRWVDPVYSSTSFAATLRESKSSGEAAQ
ncbi:acyltransferase family protein [Leifsonia sp. AG29]|uniref:acyltransferase family protein n=1 Tax=Leifsonia sp. AG29 TaxID=2598860 RepID=UPI001E51D212|nr:acyltransferase [Leifsonia sp. AG29]